MLLEMRVKLLKLHDGKQNCDICQKLIFIAFILAPLRINPEFLR
jgi:hypothetical protein